MSISIAWTNDPKNQAAVLAAYRSMDLLSQEQIAERLQTTLHNVNHVLKTHMPLAEKKALARVRYSRSKEGEKNPMHGKMGEAHHNWIGACEDGYGYLTCLHNGKREFVHRVVMMQAIGVDTLPEALAVHHIDGNPKNNALDNLALVTNAGHKEIHYLQAKDASTLALRKSTLRDALQYMTSPCEKTPAI